MRYLAAALIAALAGLAVVLPDPGTPAAGQAAGVEEPPVAVCPVQEGSGRSTDIAVLSTVNGPIAMTLFTGGGVAGSIGTETGVSGSNVIPVGDVAAVGTVGGLVELPVASSAAGVVTSGAESLVAEACVSVPASLTFLSGGSTVSGETFEMQLMNPYAGEAIATLRVTSEAGVESNERFNSVIVPPRSSIPIDFTQLIPGRESLSVSVETSMGRVIAVGRQGVQGESALWTAVEPAEDWFLPVPRGGASKVLSLATPSGIDVDYQIDLYGPNGFEEAFSSGVLAPGERAQVNLAEISEDATAVRVIATGPLVPTLQINAGGTLATTTAASGQANRWLLPGAGPPPGGFANVVVMNPGLDDSTVRIRALRDETSVRSFVVEADDVIEVGLNPADGYLVEATNPVVVLWAAGSDSGGAASVGVPLSDG